MQSTPRVIVYRYDGSPFAAKLDNVLAYKGIPHERVSVPMTLPRPDVTDRLGIGYRRIPLLAIGNDVYCDTSLIIPVIERTFSNTEGSTTLFPNRKGGIRADTGLIKAFAMSYTDRTVFPLAASLLPYQKFPASFIEDRSAWQGVRMDVDALTARQPLVKSAMLSHLTLLEEQLADGREWLFDTESPSLADFSAHFVYSWIMNFKIMKDAFNTDTFPHTIAWINRLNEILKTRKQQLRVTNVTGEMAAKAIADAAVHRAEISFDAAEAERLGLKQGSTVTITPEDNAKDYPTHGKLVGLNREEFVLELHGKDVPSLRCHFPRLNFIARSADGSKL